MIVLDHIENIVLPENFPIKNLHALKYHSEGLYYLAKNIRDEEIRKYKLGAPLYEAISMENHDILMNMFNWFSISIINFVRLVGFVDYVVKNQLTQNQLKEQKTKKSIKKYTNNYVKKIIPDIVLYRNKLSAHHSLIDPWENDNLATLFTSSMNTIVYRKPYFEASLFIQHSDGKSNIKPWILTKLYEELCLRFWPTIHLEKIPTYPLLTNFYKGLEAEETGSNTIALEYYEKTIIDNIDNNNIHIQVQVASSLIQKALILKQGLNFNGALIENKKLIDTFSHIDNLEMQKKVAKAIFNQCIIYQEIQKYNQALIYVKLYFKKYYLSKDLEILTGLGDLLINKSIYLAYLHKYNESLSAYDETIQLFQTYSNPELYVYEVKALVNKASLLSKLNLKEEALQICKQIDIKFNKSNIESILEQVRMSKRLVKDINEDYNYNQKKYKH